MADGHEETNKLLFRTDAKASGKKRSYISLAACFVVLLVLAILFIGVGIGIGYAVFGITESSGSGPNACPSAGPVQTELAWGALLRYDGKMVSVLDKIDDLLKTERINQTLK